METLQCRYNRDLLIYIRGRPWANQGSSIEDIEEEGTA